MAPPSLNMSDIFTIYNNYEASNVKIWEIIRSYDPIEFAKFLYVLENVTKSRKRLAIHLDDNQIADFSSINRPANKKRRINNDINDVNNNNSDYDDDIYIPISKFKTLRIERCVDYYKFDNEIFSNRQYQMPESQSTNQQASSNNNTDGDDFDDISNNLNIQRSTKDSNTMISSNDNTLVRSEISIFWNRNDGSKFTQHLNTKYRNLWNVGEKRYPDINITNIMNDLRNEQITKSHKLENDTKDNKNNKSIDHRLTSVYARILNHNIGTFSYASLLTNIRYLLFNDNFQLNRNDINGRQNNQTLIEQFLLFYKNLTFSQTIDNDPRNFHFLVVPQPRQFPTIELNYWQSDNNLGNDASNFIYQPYFHGIHLVVYSSPTETKCFNRFGDLYANFAYNLRSKEPCTFEAVILPTDSYGNTRSWRYWQYRQNWRMYIVDVYRYKQMVLLSKPFEERIIYAKKIANGNEILSIPDNLKSIDYLFKEYRKNKDIYDSIIGIYRRHRKHILCEPSLQQLSMLENGNDRLNTSNLRSPKTIKHIDHRRNSYILFNLLYTFDMLDLKVIPLDKSCDINRLHMNLEMADYKVLCLGYGHTESKIYLCRYDRTCHQFVHSATLERLNIESCKLHYKPDKIYVINNKIIPQGILYLRVYFDINYNVVGYDTKITDGRFKLPYDNILYNIEKTI